MGGVPGGGRCWRSSVSHPRDVPGAAEGGADRCTWCSAGRHVRALAGAERRLRHGPRGGRADVRAAAAQRLLDHDRRRARAAGGARRGLPGVRRVRGRVRLPRRRPRDRRRRPARCWPTGCPSVPWTFTRAVDSQPRPAAVLASAARPCPAWCTCGRPARRAGWTSGTTTCSRRRSPTRRRRPADARRRAGAGARAVAGAPGRARLPRRPAGPAGRLGRRAYVDAGLRPLLAAPSSTTRWSACGSSSTRPPCPATAGCGRTWPATRRTTSCTSSPPTSASRPRGFDRDHYDVPSEYYDDAVAAGAVPVSSRDLVVLLVRAGLRRRKNATPPTEED